MGVQRQLRRRHSQSTMEQRIAALEYKVRELRLWAGTRFPQDWQVRTPGGVYVPPTDAPAKPAGDP